MERILMGYGRIKNKGCDVLGDKVSCNINLTLSVHGGKKKKKKKVPKKKKKK